MFSLFVPGCTGDSEKRATPPTATSSSVGPLLGTFAMGDRVTLPDGDNVQVHGYSADITPSNQFSRPRPGSTFAVIDVQACSGQSPTPSGLLNPFFFHLAMPDASKLQAGIPVREPALDVASLEPGECRRGFVTFEVPSGVTPVEVVYGIPEASIRWTVS